MNRDKRFELVQYAFRYAIFEITWPSFKWINSIKYNKGVDTLIYYVVYDDRPNDSDISDVSRLMSEAFEFMLKHQGVSVKYSIEFMEECDVPGDAEIVFDESVFLEIAKEVAPWRLKDGR